MRTLLALIAAVSLTSAVYSQDGQDFQALAWLEGCWVGDGLGGEVSECWMTSPDGRMVGAFQIVENGALNFFEMLLIGEVDGISGYHVKHYNADFSPWEDATEQVSFPFISAHGTRVEFEGLIYELDPDGVLTVQLSFANGGVAEFSLRRADE